MGLYAAVASRPAYFRMIRLPPGCSCSLYNEIWSHLVVDWAHRKEVCDIIHFAVNDDPAITGAAEVSFSKKTTSERASLLRVVLCHVAQ
jgi:hypothetical protein